MSDQYNISPASRRVPGILGNYKESGFTSPSSSKAKEESNRSTEARKSSNLDDRVHDDSFVLCLALCYLGIPASKWRDVSLLFLAAAEEDFKTRLGEIEGPKEFRKFKTAYYSMSTFNLFKLIIVFLGECKIGLISVKSIAKCAALQERALRLVWVHIGVRRGSLLVASQIIAKVNVYLELAILSNCAAYCGATGCVNTILAFTEGASKALADYSPIVLNTISDVADAIVVRPIVIARNTLDPKNWNTENFESGNMLLHLIGNSIWQQLNPDDVDAFVVNTVRPISSFSVPVSLMIELAEKMTTTVTAKLNINTVFTSNLLLGLTALEFTKLLKEWRLLSFKADPTNV